MLSTAYEQSPVEGRAGDRKKRFPWCRMGEEGGVRGPSSLRQRACKCGKLIIVLLFCLLPETAEAQRLSSVGSVNGVKNRLVDWTLYVLTHAHSFTKWFSCFLEVNQFRPYQEQPVTASLSLSISLSISLSLWRDQLRIFHCIYRFIYLFIDVSVHLSLYISLSFGGEHLGKTKWPFLCLFLSLDILNGSCTLASLTVLFSQ